MAGPERDAQRREELLHRLWRGYLLLGIAGFVAGEGADKMLTLIPDQLMFGRMDHIVHILLGAIYLIGGFSTATVRHTRTV